MDLKLSGSLDSNMCYIYAIEKSRTGHLHKCHAPEILKGKITVHKDNIDSILKNTNTWDDDGQWKLEGCEPFYHNSCNGCKNYHIHNSHMKYKEMSLK